MLFKLGIFVLCFLFSGGNVRDSKFGVTGSPAPRRDMQSLSDAIGDRTEAGTSSSWSVDTCALIEKSEITSVQGVEVQQTQPSSQRHGGLEISQCYYTAISADGLKNLGVYLQVIHRDPTKAGREAIKEYWNERFGREAIEKFRVEDEAKEKTRTERQKAKAIRPPQRVSGIGDEAFWLASSRGGALFVLKKDKVVRISVGGTNDVSAEIQKSKALAKKALARLN